MSRTGWAAENTDAVRERQASHLSSLQAHTNDPSLPYVPENSLISLQVFDLPLNRGIDQSWSCRTTDRTASAFSKSNVKEESKVKFLVFNSCSWVWLVWTQRCCLTILGFWFLFLFYLFFFLIYTAKKVYNEKLFWFGLTLEMEALK